jgi:hypothetical protein
MGKHASRYEILHINRDAWEVSCPGAKWGLCSGHTFKSEQEARAWIKEEETK